MQPGGARGQQAGWCLLLPGERLREKPNICNQCHLKVSHVQYLRAHIEEKQSVRVDMGDGQLKSQMGIGIVRQTPDPRKYQRLTPGSFPDWTQPDSATWKARK